MPPRSTILVEENSEINQGASILLQSQEKPGSKELVSDPALVELPVMQASLKLPGTSKLFVENFAGYYPCMSTHDQTPNGYLSPLGFASVIFDNLSNWNEMVGIIGLEPQLLNGESNFATSNHEVQFVPVDSEAGSYLNTHNVLEQPQNGRQIEENGRTSFHPNDVCEFSIPTPEGPDGSGCLRKYRHLQGDEGLINQPIFKIQEDNKVDPVAGITVMNKGKMASAFSVLERTRTRRSASLIISNMDAQQVSHGIVEADGTSHVNYGGSSHKVGRESSGSLHEDTRDLEALMSSDDDETSTGRSPTDCTWNNTPIDMSDGDSIGSSSGTYKRKACGNQCFEEDEVDILCQEVESELRENTCLQFSDLNWSTDENYQYGVSFRTSEPVMGWTTSNSSAALHPPIVMMQDSFNAKLCHAYTTLSGLSAVRKRPRKEKIKMIVKLLRSIIPGGNSMDTADVLGEAIQYVQSLQSKVSKLEATKRARI